MVKNPSCKKPTNLLSVINIGLLTLSSEQFGKRDSFDEYLNNYYEGSMRNFLNERKKVAREQSTSILLAARVVIPRLVCTKEFQLSLENFGA